MCRIGAFLRYTYIVVLQYCTWGKHSLFITTTRSWSSSHSLCYLSLPHRGWTRWRLSLYCSAWHMWHRLTLDRWVHFDVNSNCTNRESSHWPCPACVVDHRVLRLSGSPLMSPRNIYPSVERPAGAVRFCPPRSTSESRINPEVLVMIWSSSRTKLAPSHVEHYLFILWAYVAKVTG